MLYMVLYVQEPSTKKDFIFRKHADALMCIVERRFWLMYPHLLFPKPAGKHKYNLV